MYGTSVDPVSTAGREFTKISQCFPRLAGITEGRAGNGTELNVKNKTELPAHSLSL